MGGISLSDVLYVNVEECNSNKTNVEHKVTNGNSVEIFTP